MGPSVDVPQEIIDLVVDNFATDLNTLRQCSYVSPSFHLSCRRHLFASITVNSAGQCERLNAILSSNTEILHMIRKLSVVESEWAYMAPQVEATVQLIADCGKLEEFYLYKVVLRFTADQPTVLNSSAAKDLFKSPRLNSVTIKGASVCLFPMDLLMGTPSLQHLAFDSSGCFNNAMCDTPLNQGTEALSSPSFHLHSLDVRSNHADYLMQYLRGSLSQLHTLRIWLPKLTPSYPPISCQLLPELRLIVIELDYYKDIESFDVFATDGLPHSVEHLVILIPFHNLNPFCNSLPFMEERISAMLTPVDEYPHIHGIHFVMVVRQGRDSPPSQERLLESFPLLQETGLLDFLIGDVDKVTAALKVLEESVRR